MNATIEYIRNKIDKQFNENPNFISVTYSYVSINFQITAYVARNFREIKFLLSRF